MTNSGPNTNGLQFFITTERTSWINGHHVVFDEVQQGMYLVRKIENLGNKSGDTSEAVTIANSGVHPLEEVHRTLPHHSSTEE